MMGRTNMGREIATAPASRGNGVMKKKGGGLLGMISPAASLVKSLKAGEPVGLMKMTGVGAMMGKKNKENDAQKQSGKSVSGMKAGGKVSRGDGCCMKGKTKGKMY